ncbi:hypothetical protein [Shewanella baltica]|uniref:hypothetical protein n=1 Tax=Shewanella baltica TaxID=62322 RepID=UPI0002112CBA|nr:hypothetical protein [Shewanella baltica]AEH16185.1 hypothetical protein Sbal117_4547 [Shewanella baltica OS117]
MNTSNAIIKLPPSIKNIGVFNNEQYNQYIIDNVVDFEGDNNQEKCQNCGQDATRHNFEACHSGSVNRHYTLNCEHCGFHSCDQDVCRKCEYPFDGDKAYNEGFMYQHDLETLAFIALDNLNIEDNKVFDDIKIMLYQECHEIDFSRFYFADSLTHRFNFMSYLLIEIMDRRFDIWLDHLDDTF